MLETILYSCLAGVIIAVCVTVISKNSLGKFVKTILDEKAMTEGSAKTLAELGFEKNFLVKQALKNKNGLGKVVSTAESDGETKYFISDEKSFRAESLYNPHGGSIMIIFITAVVFIALIAVLFTVIPDLIQMAKNAFS